MFKKYDVVIMAILVGICLYVISIIGHLKDKVDSYEKVISEKNAEIEYHRNENGKLIASKTAAEMAASDIKKMYPDIYQSIRRDLDIKVKDLRAYIGTSFQAGGSGKGEVHNHYYTDSSGHRRTYNSMSVDDGFLKFKASIYDSLNSPYSYTYTDSVKQAISVKRNWLFGKETLYGSATLSNPNARVTGSQNILIKEYRDKRFGLGVGLLYDPFVGQMRFGIGVQYNLLKF